MPENVEIIVKYNGDLGSVGLALNARVEILDESFAILTLEPEHIPELFNFKQIEFIELPKTLTLSLRESMTDACIPPARQNYGLSGRGVLIGVIDSGIDYSHPDFRDATGKSRVLFLWDQLGVGQPPQGFNYGVEYNNSQLNEFLQGPRASMPSLDFVGHGTPVAGIAAGNGGVAPEASLIVVKLGRRGPVRTTEIMRAIKYIMDHAVALNMPVVINLSFGTNNGSHAGDSLFEAYINAMAGRWHSVIVVAMGNEGAAGHHFGGQIQPNQTIEAAFTVSENLDSLFLTLWKNFADTLDLELIAPGGQSGGVLRAGFGDIKQMDLGGDSVTVAYRQPTIHSRSQEAFFQLSGSPITQGIWRLRIIGRYVTEGEFHIWLPTIEEVGLGTAFLTPDPALTLTIPATAQNVISVGGYNSLLGAAADFSGRGYTFRDIFTKPDLVAPAVNILASRIGGGYGSFTGTSMAAPFVTGSAALMMEWGIIKGNDPFLYGQRVKAFLQKSAAKKIAIPHPNPIWGYGALCLKAAMDYLLQYITPTTTTCAKTW